MVCLSAQSLRLLGVTTGCKLKWITGHKAQKPQLICFLLSNIILPIVQKYLQVYVDSKGQDHPAHLCSFVRTLAVCSYVLKYLHRSKIRVGIRLILFLFLDKNICCGYSLEVSQGGASNEYQQHMFLLGGASNEYLQHMFLSRI